MRDIRLSQNAMKILLIEDDAEIADYMVRGLRERGHLVDQAENGRDGSFLAEGETYDAMIMDRTKRGKPGGHQ